MTSYLSRLARRSRSVSGSLRPRLALPFEPDGTSELAAPQEGSQAPSPAVAEEAVPDRVGYGGREADSRAIDRPVPHRGRPTAPMAEPARQDRLRPAAPGPAEPLPIGPTPVAAHAPEVRPSEPPSGERQAAAPRDGAVPDPAAVPGPPRRGAQAAGSPAEEALHAALDEAVAKAAGRRPEAGPQVAGPVREQALAAAPTALPAALSAPAHDSAPQVADEALETTARRDPGPARETPAAPGDVVGEPSGVTREAGRQWADRAAPDAAEQAPLVSVTIGRVEVRAVPPPAVAGAPPTPGPDVMSLAEYLRSRDGERP